MTPMTAATTEPPISDMQREYPVMWDVVRSAVHGNLGNGSDVMIRKVTDAVVLSLVMQGWEATR